MIKEAAVTPSLSRAIDILRGLASLGVIWGHSMYGLSLPIELNGAFWVWIFLPISGYLVGRGFLSGRYAMTPSGFSQFLFNRLLRIIPLAYIALFIGLLVHLAYEKDSVQILRQFLFISANNDMSLVGALWTIAVELHFYLAAIVLAPLVFLIWRNCHWIFIGFLFFVFVLIGCYWIQRVGDVPIQPRTFLGNIVFFTFGLFLACMKSVRFRRANELKSVLIVGLIATGWWLQNYHIQYFWASGERYLPIGGGAIVALMITAVALGIKIPEGDEAKREYGILKYLMSFLEKLGFYCYGIYIWHAVLAMLNGKIWQFPPGVDRLMILLVALLLAPLSYKFIEKPFLRLKINA